MSNEIEKPESVISLSRRDRVMNAVQSILKGVPYIGESLEHFIFGPMAELRMRRIEITLTEVAEALREKSALPSVDNENFVNLLETINPALSRATNEDRRQRFRDYCLILPKFLRAMQNGKTLR